MNHYALWLTEDQKQIVLKYIQDRRYTYMISMYVLFFMTVLVNLYSFPVWFRIFHGIGLDADDFEFLSYAVFTLLASLAVFLKGIGITFGRHSDYDCLKRDQYQLDFREFDGKLPDTGKHPYYVRDIQGTEYICPLFLDYKKAEQGSTLLCVTLANGKRYALLEKVDLEKHI